MEVTEEWLAEEEEPADIDASFRGRREEGEGVAWVGAGREPDAERADEEDREGVDWRRFLGEEAEERPAVEAGEVGVGMLRFGVGEADEEKLDNSKLGSGRSESMGDRQSNENAVTKKQGVAGRSESMLWRELSVAGSSDGAKAMKIRGARSRNVVTGRSELKRLAELGWVGASNGAAAVVMMAKQLSRVGG
eukprot:jgi/Psemu1/37031/gm1.37031_g